MAPPREEMSALFPIFLLSMMALVVIPWTVTRVLSSSKSSKRPAHCPCSLCKKAAKNQTSVAKQVGNFLSITNVMLMLAWLAMGVLLVAIQSSAGEVAPFEPYSILGLQPGASDGEIRKAYRAKSKEYHPDKNPDPKATAYFVEFVTKAYKALTDEAARANLEKYGNVDGPQGMAVGIALPKFMLDLQGQSGGLLLACLVGGGILAPLLAAVVYLSRASKYNSNKVMNQTLYNYYTLMKPSLASSKVLEVAVHAQEYLDMPVRRSDDEALQRLFTAVRSELGLDPKNLKQEQAKFWKKQHPALIKGELLLLAQLTGQASSVPAALQADFASCLAAASRLLEELMKMALVARPPLGRGWLRPAQGVMEVSQGLVQAIPLSARKAAEKAPAVAELLQLPHCSEQLAKRLGRKRVRSLQDLLDLDDAERAELLQGGGLTAEQAADVEAVLGVVPQLELDATAETEGEEGVQEGDVLTLRAWVTLTRREAPPHTLPHTPLFPYPHEEGWWLILADGNDTLVSQKVTWADEEGAVAAAKKGVEEAAEQLAAPEGAAEDMRRVEDKIRGGARLVTAKFLAPAEGIHLFTCYCLSDTWLGVDAKCSIKLKVSKRSRAGTRGAAEAAGWGEERGDDDAEEREEGEDEEEEDELEDEDYESEYSSEEEEEEEEEERAGKKGQVRKKGQDTEEDSKSTITEIDGEAGKALVKMK